MDPQTVKLAGLVEARRDLVNRRTQVLNQLTSLRRDYYPQPSNWWTTSTPNWPWLSCTAGPNCWSSASNSSAKPWP